MENLNMDLSSKNDAFSSPLLNFDWTPNPVRGRDLAKPKQNWETSKTFHFEESFNLLKTPT